jgi:uncharacterized protein YrrD
MLYDIKTLEGCEVESTDGPIGHVDDFYFDDAAWVVRYLVVETGGWLASRKVLVSPIAVSAPDSSAKRLAVSLTQEQVRQSPNIDTDKPVSRQHELEHFAHYGDPAYWRGSDLAPRHADDPHLRSCNAVVGYHLQATDGELGHVQGLLVDDCTWAILYLIVETGNWWGGHQVLVAPAWAGRVSWVDKTVTVGLTRHAVQNAPAYDHALPLDRLHEMRLYEHYGRPGYWAGAEARRTEPRGP